MAGARGRSAATLAILIPPSVPLVIYGVWSETSIGALFIADIVPGVILSLFFAVAVLVQRGHYPPVPAADDDVGGEEARGSVGGLAVGTLSIVGIFMLVIGGIYAGLFTPTEASGVGVAGVLAIALLARRLSLAALTVLMEIAMITPPIGLNVFVLERATGVPAQRIFAGMWPFVIAALVLVVLLIFFPAIATWLPATMR